MVERGINSGKKNNGENLKWYFPGRIVFVIAIMQLHYIVT